MQTNGNLFYLPLSLPEFFANWYEAPLAEPFSQDALELAKQNGQQIEMPPQYISLDNIEELRKISRTERYLEIGSKATLRDILKLGRSVPKILREALEGAASPLLHPLVSFGACVRPKTPRSEIAAALTALDARYELRSTPVSSRWLSASRYAALAKQGAASNRELLTRIRVPLEEWDYSIYRKIRQSDGGDSGDGAGSDSMVLLFLTRMQKDILTDIRVVFTADAVYRVRSAEGFLTGKHLPLAERDAETFVSLWKDCIAGIETLTPMRQEIAALCIESCIAQFID
ncbi:MAG: FAD binding domain-containing protein [Spirochaetaceae bacterium]|jgi:CO/xanthine dehydrogenase FAD-binding subunit|nr:FAD binding domain-containing protein [Spirochaetaceae bacterium]